MSVPVDAKESAKEHAVLDVPVVAPETLKPAILAALLSRRYESVTHIAVCSEETFLGIIKMEDLLPAKENASAASIMNSDSPKVLVGKDQEIAAWNAVQSRATALAVVDEAGKFHGIIPPLTLLDILHHEHEEDLSRVGGYLKGTEKTRASSLESVSKRFYHRLPWLLLGLLGAMLSADIIGRFEAVLKEHILIAFFIPSIVYLADAVGTQTETVIVRGMSVGVRLKEVILRELLTGFFIGMAMALVAFPLLLWHWGKTDVALGVSLAIFAACSTASATAMVIPWALGHMGLDPAYGSGPLATVIQDVVSILIYFTIATRII